MKYLYILIAVSLVTSTGCKKDKKYEEVTATIVEKSGYGYVTYAAVVDNPDPKKYSFLCEIDPISSYWPQYSCADHIFFKNLPASLAVVGKKIRFSRFKDFGQPMMLSSVNHAHELDVYDAEEVR